MIEAASVSEQQLHETAVSTMLEKQELNSSCFICASSCFLRRGLLGERSHRDREERGETKEESQLRLLHWTPSSRRRRTGQDSVGTSHPLLHTVENLSSSSSARLLHPPLSGEEKETRRPQIIPANSTQQLVSRCKQLLFHFGNCKCKFVCFLGVKVLIFDF